MNRDAYEQVIKEDIEYLLLCPKSIIRDHIQAVLQVSPDREYGPNKPPRAHWPIPATPNPSSTVGAYESPKEIIEWSAGYSAGIAAERERIREAVEKLPVVVPAHISVPDIPFFRRMVLAIIDSTTPASGKKE